MKIINYIEDLYGILNPYIDKPLSDDNIDDNGKLIIKRVENGTNL